MSIIDRLFGKRYRKGWPRGVYPLAPAWVERLKHEEPALWARVKDMTVPDAIEALRQAGIRDQFERECG